MISDHGYVAYCVGQPSAVVVNDTVYLFYSSIYGVEPGPNPGFVLLATSIDGINFNLVNDRSVICLLM